jgi:hypothetical protein
MLLVKNYPFTNVVANGVATLSLPIGMSYNRIILALGGTFTKAMITDIKVKLNGKVILQNTGSRVDAINTFRGITANTAFLTLDFTELFAKRIEDQYLGNLNTAKGVSSLTIEITIAGATAPTLDSYSELAQPNVLGAITKQIVFTQSIGAAGKFPMKLIDVANRGALIKSIHFFNGGNVTALEVKKNGIVIFDNIPMAVNNYNLTEYRNVPQANVYHYDPTLDNNYSNMIVTSDATSLDFNLTTSAADTINAVVEVIDVLGNM